MTLTSGIVGLPNCGKTTLFNAFTASDAARAAYPFSTTDAAVAMVEVPDERLETIHRFIETDRIVPATLQVVDIPGLVSGASKGEGLGNRFLGHVKECDAILHVVRCFEGAEVVREGPVDPASDMEVLELELAMADLDTVTRGVDRTARKAKSGDKQAVFEQQVYTRAKELLEEGRLLRTVEWSPAELEALRPLFLITLKPMLYVANVGQDDVDGASEHARAVARHAAETGSEAMHLCGDIECELVAMDAADRAEFMRELGMQSLALPLLIRAAYGLLGLQTFFTAGPKEIKAWTVRRGDKGPKAAGVIHSDFEKGYIRAEVYSVDDLVAHASEHAIKAAGRLRVEGRDYEMREGDVVHFLVATK
jgi:ribosome-binding ATPase